MTRSTKQSYRGQRPRLKKKNTTNVGLCTRTSPNTARHSHYICRSLPFYKAVLLSKNTCGRGEYIFSQCHTLFLPSELPEEPPSTDRKDQLCHQSKFASRRIILFPDSCKRLIVQGTSESWGGPCSLISTSTVPLFSMFYWLVKDFPHYRPHDPYLARGGYCQGQ
ncbi:hypothetical protein BDW71DRAFT_103653 [Aspergillus fruticulosus]